ncbi:hypothetical protein N656DRAFT_718792 [Canariomyces notabilis]|uniref:Uncharacterized protein n=1 Tax=Canariomyces notabilis TaxID=2074819 RepID=A0AAN6QDD7_9PEZI|nr:hypothetical protein N656DRAFT_718792 [Canariomyces arenarius]
MIVRDLKRLALVVGPVLVLLFLSASLWHANPDFVRSRIGTLLDTHHVDTPPAATDDDSRPGPLPPHNETHNEIFSLSTFDSRYFPIEFGKYVFNPNIIPHPTRDETWIIMGQRYDDPNNRNFTCVELGCYARFVDGALVCVDEVRRFPIAPTPGGMCEGELTFLNLNDGPHDARVFYGPQKPYTMYGSQSGITCFGLWMQDFRQLVDWDAHEPDTPDDFKVGTEVQRPEPWAPVEKNWFIFWDKDDQMHAHYDMFPTRAFAKLSNDGSAGPDLAPAAALHGDELCMRRYLPKLPPRLESIHQATNSLKITLCNRADAGCKADDDNTFILTIIQHKTFYDWHGEYEPYVVLFYQRPPYELYAISKKSLWIHGRQRLSDTRTEMVYVTSINWKERGVRYHGYLDDVLFLGFGVEDKTSGGIDVRGADLLVDLGLCSAAS